jgi:arylsulfatase
MRKLVVRLILLQFYFAGSILFAQTKPNVVLIFPDNLGVGEVASFGGARGVPTPNIDRIGNEGIRLTNFNVEYSCTPSRIAIMTGRYAVRAGEDYYSGTTLWEEMLPERLKLEGYATALYGKWDLGAKDWLGNREPTDQGFDQNPIYGKVPQAVILKR